MADYYYNKDVRSKLREGDLLLFRGDGCLSSVIESVEGGEYSHSAFVLRWQSRIMVAQAEYPRLEAVPLSVAVHKYSGRVDWFRLKDGVQLDVQALTDEATKLLGRPFAVADLIRVGFANFLHRPIKKEPRGDRSLFCSEYVAQCFREAKSGANFTKSDNPHAVTPDMVSKSDLHQKMYPIHWDRR